MKLHTTVQNEAIVSNVGEIGEFRIRNSAKAFNILSSGLYANKIRATIRELSCNAVDSHIAAGKAATPFDVHLPNSLEPYFAIRDYGTGLTHDQVTSIYTTYFESTKTDSNAFIGALGLGSKSPFSYTDNFTVTAIKDGRKGIYTAFINDQGVPSIALMMEEATNDPAGVEVRFAVEQRYDFDKFRTEARYVYEYFTLRPVVSGNADFKFKDPSYKTKDIVPGVHQSADGEYSYAIMGNIKYPIDVPNADKVLGSLYSILRCGMVMEFNIGELDFQASREGLSYIPQTIESIKRKLEAVNGQLTKHVAIEANNISNMWERAYYLASLVNDKLWSSAVATYVADTKFELLTNNRWSAYKEFSLNVDELASKYNIVIRGFHRSRGYAHSSAIKARNEYITVNNQSVMQLHWKFNVSKDIVFIINDTKIGALERAKHHFKKDTKLNRNIDVYVIDSADKNNPVLTDAFFALLSNPPASQICMASSLEAKDRAANMGKNVTILHLVQGARRGRYDTASMVWRDAGKADTFDKNTTFYYLPLSGFSNLGVMTDVKSMHQHLINSKLFTGAIYGVRKSDIEWVKAQKNWVNLDDHIKSKLSLLGQKDVMGLVKKSIDWNELYRYNDASKVTNVNSPYLKLYNVFKDVKETDSTVRTSLEVLCRNYNVATKTTLDPATLITQYKVEVKEVYNRYPMLKHVVLNCHTDVAEYINLVDEKKGV